MFTVLFVSDQDVSHHATYNTGTSYGQQAESQEAGYVDDVVNLGAEGCEDDEEGYHQESEEAYTEEYSQEDTTEMSEDQMDYTTDLAQDDDGGYQDEVLDIQITEPLDGEFQVSSHFCLLCYRKSVNTHKHTQTRTHSSTHPFFPSLLCPRDNVSFLVLLGKNSGLKSIQVKMLASLFGQRTMRIIIASCQQISPSCWQSLVDSLFGTR